MSDCSFADTDAASRYVAGTLAREDADRFEEHAFACERCAEEVERGSAVRLALRRTRPRRRWIPLTAAAAALVVASLLLIERDDPRVRRGEDASIVVKVEGRRVEWSAVNGAARYVVTLASEDGTVVGERETTSTSTTVSSGLFVTIRALSADGEELARSKPQRVR